jgi:hypothetical protein
MRLVPKGEFQLALNDLRAADNLGSSFELRAKKDSPTAFQAAYPVSNPYGSWTCEPAGREGESKWRAGSGRNALYHDDNTAIVMFDQIFNRRNDSLPQPTVGRFVARFFAASVTTGGNLCLKSGHG